MDEQQNQGFNNFGMMYNPMIMGFGMPGMGNMMPGMYGQGFFLPIQAVNPWIYQPGFAESTYKYLTGLNLPYGVGETELYGASQQSFMDTLGIGSLTAASLAGAMAIGDLTVTQLFKPPPALPTDNWFKRNILSDAFLNPRNMLINFGLGIVTNSILKHSIIAPFEESIRTGEIYRQSLMGASPFSSNYDILRGGLRRSSMQELYQDVTEMASRDYYLSQSDYTQLIVGAGTSGILDSALGDTNKLREAIKGLAKGLKFYAQLAKDPTIIDSMKELATLSQMGVNVNELVITGTQLALGAKQAGFVYNQLSPYVTQFGQQFMGTGISPVHAMQGFTQSLITAKSMDLAMRAEGNTMLGAFGGLEGIQQQIATMPTSLAASPLGQLSMYSTLTRGGTSITNLLTSMTPNEYLNMQAFQNVYTSLGMQNPNLVGADALKQSIQMAKMITGGSTPIYLVKNIARSYGLSDNQIDILLEEARMNNVLLRNEATSYNNTYSQAMIEKLEETNPSIFRQIGTGVAEVWNVTKNPGRYLAVGYQRWVEGLRRDFMRGYNNPEEMSLIGKIWMPIAGEMFPSWGASARLIKYDLSQITTSEQMARHNEDLINYIAGIGPKPKDLSAEQSLESTAKIANTEFKIRDRLENFYRSTLGIKDISTASEDQLTALSEFASRVQQSVNQGKSVRIGKDIIDKISPLLPDDIKRLLVTSGDRDYYTISDVNKLKYTLWSYAGGPNELLEKGVGSISIDTANYVKTRKILERLGVRENVTDLYHSSIKELIEDEEFIDKYVLDKDKFRSIASRIESDKNITADEAVQYRKEINSLLNVDRLNRDNYMKHDIALTTYAGDAHRFKTLLSIKANAPVILDQTGTELSLKEVEQLSTLKNSANRQLKTILDEKSRLGEIYGMLDEDSRNRLQLQAEIMKDSINSAFETALSKFAEDNTLRVTVVEKGDKSRTQVPLNTFKGIELSPNNASLYQ